MNIFVTDPSPIQSARNLPTSTLSRCHSRLAKCCPSYTATGITASANYTIRRQPYRTAHGAFATIHVHSGLPPTSTILHGSYARLALVQSTYVTQVHTCQDVITSRTYLYKSVRQSSCQRITKVVTSHVPCQSLSSSTLLSTLLLHTSSISTPSRG